MPSILPREGSLSQKGHYFSNTTHVVFFNIYLLLYLPTTINSMSVNVDLSQEKNRRKSRENRNKKREPMHELWLPRVPTVGTSSLTPCLLLDTMLRSSHPKNVQHSQHLLSEEEEEELIVNIVTAVRHCAKHNVDRS